MDLNKLGKAGERISDLQDKPFEIAKSDRKINNNPKDSGLRKPEIFVKVIMKIIMA